MRNEELMEPIEYIAYLKTINTPHLLSLRQFYTWNKYYYEDLFNEDYELNVLRRKAVYDELDTREHVPNKVEKKLLRQARGKLKRNNGRKVKNER